MDVARSWLVIAATLLPLTAQVPALAPAAAPPQQPASAPPAGMVWIDGGRFVMGSQNGDADAPLHEVEVDGFWLDATEVTNEQFAAFVAATGYLTDAEKVPTAEDLPGVPEAERVPGSLVFVPPAGDVDRTEFWQWWEYRKGACWQRPEGPGSDLQGRGQHPVVHVSWRDAQAYCSWAKKRLPTEAEWERAARGGLLQQVYVWGDEQRPADKWLANIWQGPFPRRNERADGFAATAPVRSYPPNSLGLYEVSGNVWEWVQDRYRPDGYLPVEGCQRNPRGPKDSFDPQEPGADKRVMRGGSFLCSDSYCLGYQPGTRMKSSPDTGLCHTGFRCARDR